jgi:hypothetical protein
LDEAGGCAFANEGSGFVAGGELRTGCDDALVVGRPVSEGRASEAAACRVEDSLFDFGGIVAAGGVLGAAVERLGAGFEGSALGTVAVLLGAVAAVLGAGA